MSGATLERLAREHKLFCSVCGGLTHVARATRAGLECPARVIRILPDFGSASPGSDPGTR